MVENDTSSVEYQLSTSTGPFSIPFYFIENGHIVAELYTQNGDDFNKTTLNINVDYYLNGAGDKNGGQLTLLSAHSGATLLIYRDPDATQLTSYLATGKFPATSHERALDKLTMLIQKFGWWWDSLSLKKPNLFANYYDALNNRIRNLRDPSQAQDAATKNYADTLYEQAITHSDNNLRRTLRVPEASVDMLPGISGRKKKILAFNDNGNPIAVLPESGSAADVLINLGSNEEDLGIALLGLPGSGSLKNIIGKWTSPEAWGVITDSQSDAHANSKKMFNMFEWLRSLGGGVAYFTPGKTYWIDFIQFVPSNVVIIGYGATVKQINPLSMYGRGGFVFGSGREWNYQKAKAAYNSGNYPSSVADSTMAELPLKSYLRDNQSYVQCEKCKVYGLRMSAVFTDSSYWGGYAFNCVNAQHIRFFDVVGDGWTQLFNFGNDSIASSPSCYDVIARGSTIEKPDLVRTYYAYGFMANSTDCWIEYSNLLTPMTAGTLNGSGAAVNMVENCGFRNPYC